MLTFSLHSGQAPDRPESTLWIDQLRWLICVIDPDDTSLAFIASVFGQALKNAGNLSKRQSDACQKILNRVARAHDEGRLDCQHFVPGFEEAGQ